MGKGRSKIGGSSSAMNSGGTATVSSSGNTSSGRSANETYYESSKSYTVDYQPYARGQISKTDAGQLYKAVKNDAVVAKPELVSELYDGAQKPIRMSSERYAQDSRYYDNVYHLTHALLNNDYGTAQLIINSIEKDNIQRASKQSRWYKYKHS